MEGTAEKNMAALCQGWPEECWPNPWRYSG